MRARPGIQWIPLVLLASLFLALPGFAQDAAAEEDEDELLGIDEIVVTAERRSTSIQDVAATINAFALEDLTKQNIQDIFDLQLEVPSLVATGGLPAITLRGIGQDTEVLGPGIDPGFQLHINDIYVSQVAVALLDFHDLERIEVLPGPQGTTSGRNSTGGSINFHYSRPDLENHIVSGDVEFGSYHKVRARGVVNIPLIDDELAFRFSWLQEWPAKPIKVTGANGHTQKLRSSGIGAGTALRGFLRWRPTEDVTTDFIMSWSRDTNPGGASSWEGAPTRFPSGASPIFSGLRNLNAATPNSNSNNIHHDLTNDQRTESVWGQWITTVELPGDLTLKLNANYQYFDFNVQADSDGTDVAASQLTLQSTSHTWSGEATIASNWDGPINFIFGTNYQTVDDKTRVTAPNFQDNSDLANYQVFDTFNLFGVDTANTDRICGGPCIFQPRVDDYVDNFNINGDTETEALGIFLDGTYNITEELSITAGVRYSYTHRDFDDSATRADLYLEAFDTFTDNSICAAVFGAATAALFPTGPDCFGLVAGLLLTPTAIGAGGAPVTAANAVFLAPVTGSFDPTTLGVVPFDREESYDSIDGRLRLEWRPEDGQLFYAGVSQGERHGGFQFVGNPFPSEKILAYEVGAKNTFLDGLMFLNTSLFYYDFKNRFLQQTENNIPSILNAPKVRVYGVEFQWIWVVTEALRVNANVGYLKSEFTQDFFTQDNTLSEVNPTGFCGFKMVGDQHGTGPTCDGGLVQNIRGNTLPRSPEWTVSFGVEYGWEFASGTMTTRLDFTWRDDMNFRWFENDIDGADSYTRTDLRIRWDPNDGTWWTEIFVQNLEDDDEIRSQLSGTTNGRTYNFSAPRSLGLRIGYEFENSDLPWIN
jgi:outer membrane receptor protein involved in Fe transport